jgi:hypothetical protein
MRHAIMAQLSDRLLPFNVPFDLIGTVNASSVTIGGTTFLPESLVIVGIDEHGTIVKYVDDEPLHEGLPRWNHERGGACVVRVVDSAGQPTFQVTEWDAAAPVHAVANAAV